MRASFTGVGMMRDTVPITRELLLLGGGHAHVEVIRRWPHLAVRGARVTLVSRLGTAPYSGMLPGLIAGHYAWEDANLELGPLCRRSDVGWIQATVTGLDVERGLVHCLGRPPLRFDLLSLNTGSMPDLDVVPGVRAYAVPVKPVDGLLAALADWEARVTYGEREPGRGSESGVGPFPIVVVGGGAGGIEVALALHHRLVRPAEVHGPSIPGGGRGRFRIEVVSASVEVPAGHAPAVQRRLGRRLAEAGVKLHAGRRVIRVEANELLTDSGEHIPFGALVWATEASAPAWIRSAGLATDGRGFLRVDARLRSVSHPQVFGAGDVASQDGGSRPKSGVFAVRQGPTLARNLAAALSDAPLRVHRPQRLFLSLISTGPRHAVASYGSFAWSAPWVWRWKDRIDRRWMARYRMGMPTTTMAVTGKPESADAMRCAGCGGKVGADVLRRALGRLPAGGAAAGVLWDSDQREDVSLVSVPAGQVLVQSVDSFRAMASDPWLVGRVAALHALSDLHAKGVDPHSALALVTVPWGAAGVTEELIYQVLSGALQEFAAEGVALLGGHTAEGAELAVGFTVNGFAHPGQWVAKAGARPGDRLILTKPLGTGVLLAAEMRASLKAAWRESGWVSMLRSNAPAGRCLREHGATAGTDVTGFGMLGHLGEILRASHVSARLHASRVPLLPGVREVVREGFRSSLAPANRALAETLVARSAYADWEESTWVVLTDPQTGGGLLAAVPESKAAACLEELARLGCEAAEVGEVTPADKAGCIVG